MRKIFADLGLARRAEHDSQVLANVDTVERELDTVRRGLRAAEGVGDGGIW